MYTACAPRVHRICTAVVCFALAGTGHLLEEGDALELFLHGRAALDVAHDVPHAVARQHHKLVAAWITVCVVCVAILP